MKLPALLRRLALLPAVLLLASCGEDDNLAREDVGTVASCSSIPGATCVRGRFIDDAAVNINYECGVTGSGTVRAVTGSDGGFTCPNGSEVTFSLTNPDDTRIKLVLGTTKVVKPARIFAEVPGEEPPPVYFYVTPRTLAGDEDPGTTFNTAAINIARLLQTLSTDTVDPALPSYRVIISDAAKRKLTQAMVDEIKFASPIEMTTPTAPADGTFDKQVQDFMQSFDPDLVLVDDATASERLARGVYSRFAGVYESYDPTATAGNSAAAGMRGIGGGYFVGGLWSVVDRRGRAVGSGVYSYESGADTLVYTNPKAMSLQTAPNATWVQWPSNGDLTGLQYELVNDSGVASGTSAEITNGAVTREAFAGSKARYESLFGESPNDLTDLGRWKLETGSGTLIPSGAMTLLRTVPVSPVLNPDLWTTADISFPLAVKVTLYNQDFACTSLGCPMATFRMVVLQDGNIVSDINQKCGVNIIPETLQYPSGGTEVPMGVVANILDNLRDEGGSTMRLMTLLVMVPNHSHFRTISPYLPYVQFGSGFGDDSLLRVDAGANRLRSYGLCNSVRRASGQCNVVDAFSPDIALWGNQLTAQRVFSGTGSATDQTNFGGYIISEPTPVAECQPSPP